MAKAKRPDKINGWYEGPWNKVIPGHEFGQIPKPGSWQQPFDANGNPIFYNNGQIKDLPTNRKITSKFKYGGKYGKQFVFIDTATEEKYLVFSTEIASILKGFEFDLSLEPHKRGSKIAFRKAQ